MVLWGGVYPVLGKTIAVINRSEVVGRPLAALMANDGAEVYSIDVNDILFMHRGRIYDIDMQA